MDVVEKNNFRDFLKKIYGENVERELSVEAIELLKAKTRVIRLSKGEYLQIEGDVCKYWGYVSEGLVRMYYLNQEEEITSQLAHDGDMFLDYESYFNQSPSRNFIQMLEPSTLYLFPHLECEELRKNNREINLFFRKLTEKLFLLKKKRITDTIFKPAKVRYETLIAEKPNLVLRVPSIYIASYLGITPETLSRIKTKMK
ncbi:MAG: Crp/Fnr family transcriptional regulator [Paludibacteraceae bacterium]|nr:Crp/Fnr family transcriptional regulator [Paludibacteraceae bacterium]